ncbi:MAG: maleylpyruvate isomerase family mycothiol-dependent enzyme [Actinomycetia bacterium]|nr:maleylpyruvate isomerase family mycothiol-dependent enzyme [Actinomycetes bacterium]
MCVDRVGLEAIDSLTSDIVDLATRSDLAASVPTCGDWTLADLVWHMTEVQNFWVHAIANRPQGPKTYQEPVRPAEGELAAALDLARSRLLDALDGVDPAEHAWSWATSQTVGFTLRRQTHEALIHLVDARLAVGSSLPDAAPDLWADGIDEVLVSFLSDLPDWARFERPSSSVVIRATDADWMWRFTLGRRVGVEPESGQDVDLPCLLQTDAADADATISGDAASLDLWIWGRPVEPSAISLEGHAGALSELRTVIDQVMG